MQFFAKVCLAALVGFAHASGAQAQQQAPAPTTAANAGDEMICKHEKKTGTRFAKKVCRTKAHRDLMSENANRQAQEEFSKPMIETRRE